MSQDGYIRLTARGPITGPTLANGPRALLFVDVEPEELEIHDLLGLRNATYDVVRSARWIIVRAPLRFDSDDKELSPATPLLERVAAQLERIGSKAIPGVLHQPLGEPATIEGAIPADEMLVERARAVELEALVDWAGAVWKPTDYHYRLPSGEHVDAFVRVASAVREPRDAQVIASWLHPRLVDGVGFVVDTGTLTAVLQAAMTAMVSAGMRPGAVSVLDNYPTTDYDVSRAVEPAARRRHVLALVSVNSSGVVLDRLVRALEAVGDGGAISVMINKEPVEASSRVTGGVPVDTWHPLPGREPMARSGTRRTEACPWCNDQQRSTIVPISPATFEATLKAAVRTITPSVSDPSRNRLLWELADRYDGIGLERRPPPDLEAYRPPGPMGLRIEIDEMIKEADFRDGVRRALAGTLRQDPRAEVSHLAGDLLLVPEREYAKEGMGDLIDTLRPELGDPADVRPFPNQEEWSEELRDAVKRAKSLGVLTLGTVTGTTLYQALAVSQGIREPGDLINGIVIHPRMAEKRAWETLLNAFAKRLFSPWHSFLPLRSPIVDEESALDVFSRSAEFKLLPDAAAAFFNARVRFCARPNPREQGLFWGSKPESHLTPNSIYGEALRGPAVYAAVASAMERSRKGQLARAEPERRVFELDAMVRSYYDPMILAAMMRWLMPYEAWWGWNVGDAQTIVLQMLTRLGDTEQLGLLVSEFLLAAAQGKLPPQAVEALRSKAEPLIDQVAPWQRGALELGLAMAPTSHEADTPAAVRV